MTNILYLAAAVCFIFSLQGLSSAASAKSGNFCGICGIILACAGACLSIENFSFFPTLLAIFIGAMIGTGIAKKVSMAALPQMVAGFHSLVGLSAVLISFSVFSAPELFKITGLSGILKASLFEMGLGTVVGAITFSGSVIAFLKLQGACGSVNFGKICNMILGVCILVLLIFFIRGESIILFSLLTLLSFIFGITLILPIGGADMPVIVSMLNSYSGWAASGIGFTLGNDLLIITGALVGASGAILSYIMCKGMNRSLVDVIFSKGHAESTGAGAKKSKKEVRAIKRGAPEDIAFILKNSGSVIIVPGYGMATSHAQHSLKEMAEILKKDGVSVKYAIHPVAGRMPGHMNVLLAEADVPYEDVFELDEINQDFASCDVVYVVGANDVTNPAAKNDPSSPIYGMPILEIEKAKVIVFLKRSTGVGYSGIDNELFYNPKTIMLLGDAKKNTEAVVNSL